MDLQPRTEQITVQNEFLWSTAGLVHKVGNVTLDGSAFGADGTKVKAGTVVVVDAVSGLAKKYDGATYAGGMVYVITNDRIMNGRNQQVGALEEAYLNKSKITGYHADLAADSEYRFKIRG